MTEMITWLRRQIEARLALARHAIELGNAAEWTELSSGVLMTIAPDAPQDNWDGVHPLGDSSLTRLMEANDPQDTIARCEAELAILEEHGPRDYGYDPFPHCRTCFDVGEGLPHAIKWPCRTAGLLAAGYRHWRGFEPSWLPSEVERTRH